MCSGMGTKFRLYSGRTGGTKSASLNFIFTADYSQNKISPILISNPGLLLIVLTIKPPELTAHHIGSTIQHCSSFSLSIESIAI